MIKMDRMLNRWSLPVVTFLLVVVPGTAIASSPEWRPKYDLIMMYVNFAILAGVIYKYGREPIKNFLSQQKGDVIEEMDALEEEKKRVIEEIKSAQMQSADHQQRLEEMKARLIIQGEAKKKQLIDQAQEQSAIMIEAAHKKMENRIVQAMKTLKLELADLAFDQALHQLPKVMTDSDNQKLIDDYMKSMHAE